MSMNMKVLLCSMLLLSISMVESAKVNRLRRSWRHKDGHMKNLPIHNTMCSASTCKKCFSITKYTNSNDRKIRNYCTKILNLPKCCHRNLAVRSGDFMWKNWLLTYWKYNTNQADLRGVSKFWSRMALVNTKNRQSKNEDSVVRHAALLKV